MHVQTKKRTGTDISEIDDSLSVNETFDHSAIYLHGAAFKALEDIDPSEADASTDHPDSHFHPCAPETLEDIDHLMMKLLIHCYSSSFSSF